MSTDDRNDGADGPANAETDGDGAEKNSRQYAAEREDLIDLLDVGIDEAKRKVDSGRVYDAENEKVRIKWIRALGYLVRTKRQLIKDAELEEMEERLAELEAAVDNQPGRGRP